IQRLLKLSIKRSAHRDIVTEALAQIKAGKPADEIRLDTTVGTLRNRSVGWIAQAIQDLNDPTIITQAFEMCRVGKWNLSHASLTSPEALAGLRDLPKTNPVLHAALIQTAGAPAAPVESDDADEEPYDSDHLVSGGSSIATNFSVDADGGIVRSGNAENSGAEESDGPALVLGRGQRKKIVARRY
ncbi:hypothetical protein B0H11DRAFT_1650322, partial [Mycena galericulata]